MGAGPTSLLPTTVLLADGPMPKVALRLSLLFLGLISLYSHQSATASDSLHPKKVHSRIKVHSAYQIVGSHVAVHGEVAEFTEYFDKVYILELAGRYFVYNKKVEEIISGSSVGKFETLDQAKDFLNGEYFAELADPEVNPWIEKLFGDPRINGYGQIQPRVKISTDIFLSHLDRGEVPAEFDLDRILKRYYWIQASLASATIGAVCTFAIAVLYITR
jgi:hypothetical protein